LGQFLKIIEVAQKFLAIFFPRQKLFIRFDKERVLATFCANFLTISSGHPGGLEKQELTEARAASTVRKKPKKRKKPPNHC
jgi:hypothetical protein